MKKTLIVLGLMVCCIITYAQPPQDSAYIRQNYTKMEKYITMRDGIRLFTSIYMPKDQSKKYPILMTRTPYNVGPYGETAYRKTLGQNMLLARDGFIFVYQDVRGRWMSEGNFVDVRPDIDNKKSNKDVKVGIEGISYPGFYSTASLPNAHPALKAVSPQAPVTDWFIGDDFHHNGAFFVMDGWAFYASFGKPRPQPTTVGPTGFDYYTKDNYKWYLETGALKNILKLTGDTIAFWKE